LGRREKDRNKKEEREETYLRFLGTDLGCVCVCVAKKRKIKKRIEEGRRQEPHTAPG
jgi:hypothetical protein